MRALAAVAVLLAPAAAVACPCGAALGPVAPWTQAAERVALAASLSFQSEVGTMDANARAWSQPQGVATDRGLLDLAAAWRVIPSLEIAALWSAAYTAVTLPGASSAEAVPGDASLRARWEAAIPLRQAVPQVAAWAALRMPTGTVGETSLSTVTGLGLGAWEPALGGELRWRPSGTVTLLALTEAGLRVGSLRDVTPGPRWMIAAAFAHQASARWGWTVSLSEILEGDASERGQVVDGTWTQRTTLTAGLTARWNDHFRTLATAGGDLPLPGLGRNITTQVRAGVSLVWSL